MTCKLVVAHVTSLSLALVSQKISRHLFILSFCVVGSFAMSNRMFDVWVMIGFGLLGLFLETKKIPLAPFVIGFVLGPIAEENLSAALMSSNGDWSPLLTESKSLFFLLVAVIMLALPAWRCHRKNKEGKNAIAKF